MPAAPKTQPILVKRYARSRLYDTASGCYVTVEQLREWMAKGISFSVKESESGEDITRVLLAVA
jgi:polyhydroxyalkanoate synthesis regulator protein